MARRCDAGDFVYLKIKIFIKKQGADELDIDLIFKIAGTGIIVSVLSMVLKKTDREEQAMMTTLAGLIVVLLVIVDEIGDLFEKVKTVFGLW